MWKLLCHVLVCAACLGCTAAGRGELSIIIFTIRMTPLEHWRFAVILVVLTVILLGHATLILIVLYSTFTHALGAVLGCLIAFVISTILKFYGVYHPRPLGYRLPSLEQPVSSLPALDPTPKPSTRLVGSPPPLATASTPKPSTRPVGSPPPAATAPTPKPSTRPVGSPPPAATAPTPKPSTRPVGSPPPPPPTPKPSTPKVRGKKIKN